MVKLLLSPRSFRIYHCERMQFRDGSQTSRNGWQVISCDLGTVEEPWSPPFDLGDARKIFRLAELAWPQFHKGHHRGRCSASRAIEIPQHFVLQNKSLPGFWRTISKFLLILHSRFTVWSFPVSYMGLLWIWSTVWWKLRSSSPRNLHL
jgi:hypothetical protein